MNYDWILHKLHCFTINCRRNNYMVDMFIPCEIHSNKLQDMDDYRFPVATHCLHAVGIFYLFRIFDLM